MERVLTDLNVGNILEIDGPKGKALCIVVAQQDNKSVTLMAVTLDCRMQIIGDCFIKHVAGKSSGILVLTDQFLPRKIDGLQGAKLWGHVPDEALIELLRDLGLTMKEAQKDIVRMQNKEEFKHASLACFFPVFALESVDHYKLRCEVMPGLRIALLSLVGE